MKKRILLGAAVAIVALASCTDDALNITHEEAVALKNVPVTFGTYTSKSATTRAGYEGPIVTDTLKKVGFGVFAYNTGTADYVSDGFTANFMYNQLVKHDGTNWTYDPVKYWPNLNGATDTQSPAATEANDGAQLSFFAYAPYVDETKFTATEKNIIELVNYDKADPYVKYMFPSDGKTVDLLWGTAGVKPDTTSVNVLDKAQSGKILPGGVGPVNADLTKQKSEGKIRFLFKHALSNVGGSATDSVTIVNPNSDQDENVKLAQGGFQAVLDINKGDGTKASTTVVTIKNIKITGKNTVPAGTTGEDESGNSITTTDNTYVVVGGKLNLATGVWTKTLKQNPALPEGTFNHNLTSDASSEDEKKETNGELSDAIAEPAGIIEAAQWTSLPLGVLTAPQNVYKTETNPFVFMPGTQPNLVVTVEYIVRTKDAKLKDGWTVVEQKVTKAIDFTEAIAMNKKYNLIMHMGLTDIKFEATVQDWSAFNPDPNINPSDPNYTYDPNNPADPANSVNINVYVPKNVD